MPDTARQAGWLSQISRRVREREIRRQILYNRLGNQVAHRFPTLLPEFLKMLLGSLIGFWIITALLAYIPHAQPLYTLPLFGLLFSLQATYYKYRLARDPGYKIPKSVVVRERPLPLSGVGKVQKNVLRAELLG